MTALLPVYPRLPLTVVRAEGTRLFTDDDRVIVDLYGGHAVTPLGHGHPDLRDALLRAHGTLDFFSNSVRLPVQEAAAEAVLRGSDHLAHVHFVNSGTEANEAAIHLARRLTGRRTVVTLDVAFHGRTLGSLTVTGLGGYRGRVPLDVPEDWGRTLPFGDEDAIPEVVDDTVAAVLLESVPSLAGVQLPPPGFYEAVAARCREVGALLILDEVQGGVGRLGTWFGHQSLGVAPDMVTLAKSLGGGFPVGAMVATAAIGEQVGHGELGTTFGGGPMACAMVETVRSVIDRDGLMARVLDLEARVREALAPLEGVEVTGKGALLGVRTPRKAAEVRDALLERDLLVGTSADPHGLRLLPAYVTPFEDVDRFAEALGEVLRG